MADQAVENARRRRELLMASISKAEQNLAEWRVQIGRVDRFLKDYEAFAADTLPLEQTSEPAAPRAMVDGQKRARAVGNSTKEDVAAAAKGMIETQGSPIPREQLYDALKDAGFTIEGTDPLGVMNTMLWRTRDEFGVILLRNVGYWLREREWPDTAYYPALDSLIGAEDDAPVAADEEEEEDGEPTPGFVPRPRPTLPNGRPDWGKDDD